MRIDVYTLFPEIVASYGALSILGRAQERKIFELTALDIRDGADDERRTVDDTPFGGGAGMVLKPEPIFRAVEEREATHGPARPLIALVPTGQPFTQRTAARLAELDATVRLLPGALGNELSPSEESFSAGLREYPQWTKPASFRGMEAPEVLRSGDHAKVAQWRHVQALKRTLDRRPDLIAARGGLSDEEELLLDHLARLEKDAPSG